MRLWGRRGRLARYVRGYMRFGQLCNRSYVAAGGKTRRYKIRFAGFPHFLFLYLRVLPPGVSECFGSAHNFCKNPCVKNITVL